MDAKIWSTMETSTTPDGRPEAGLGLVTPESIEGQPPLASNPTSAPPTGDARSAGGGLRQILPWVIPAIAGLTGGFSPLVPQEWAWASEMEHTHIGACGGVVAQIAGMGIRFLYRKGYFSGSVNVSASWGPSGGSAAAEPPTNKPV